MSGAMDKDAARVELLSRDEARERRTLWKGLLSFAGVLVLAIARQRWWL